MKLIIVESPSKCITIKKYLGSDYEVISSFGHVRDLKKGKNTYGFNLKTLEPEWENISTKKTVIAALKKAVAKAEHIYLATDPDREGEAIALHLKETLNISEDKYHRIIFNAIRKEEILAAIAEPSKIDTNLCNSQYTRRILDRLLGFDLSRFVKIKLKAVSAGRVQSVALKFLVDREKEINNFKAIKFYTIEGMALIGNQKIKIKYPQNSPEKLALSQEVATDYIKLLNDEIIISAISKKEQVSKVHIPFYTATLFRTAFTTFGYQPKIVLALAQELFSQGYISYHRTDSTRISSNFQVIVKTFIIEQYGVTYFKKYQGIEIKKKIKTNIQDAHEAIIVLDLKLTPELFAKKKNNSQLIKLYTLIYNRTITTFMKPPVYLKTKIILEDAGVNFEINGSQIIFDGYIKVTQKAENDIILPSFKVGDKIKISNLEAVYNETKPRTRYNAASLIKELEINGVGRPSTYSVMVSIVKDDYRNYAVELDNKMLKPTENGVEVSNLLCKWFKEIIECNYTANLEESFDKISTGSLQYKIWFHEFYDKFKKLYKTANLEQEKQLSQETDEICPKCSAPILLIKGRYNKFKGCSKYPNCKYSKTLSQKNYEKTGELCPQCQRNLEFKFNHQKEKFIACSGFPDCKYNARIDGFIPQATGEKCFECGDDIMLQKNKRTNEEFESCKSWFKHKNFGKRKKKKK